MELRISDWLEDNGQKLTLPTKAGEDRALTAHEETLEAVLTLCQDSLGLLCLNPLSWLRLSCLYPPVVVLPEGCL